MKVNDRFQIKGRGPVLCVQPLDIEIPVPVRIRAADGSEWEIRGVERYCMYLGRPKIERKEPVSFLVAQDCPIQKGDEIELVLPDGTFFGGQVPR